MQAETSARAAVIGGGPAGLMAAEVLRGRGVDVDLYEAKGSVGRKFLLAGKGGLNLTHSEALPGFATRYRERSPQVLAWLQQFDAEALRRWAQELGVATFVGSSGRVFPTDLKAAPLLRGWLRRLRASGVHFHVQHRCIGWSADKELRVSTPLGEVRRQHPVVVLALGGGSWPQLGSDGRWVEWLGARGVEIAALRPANCGFEVCWSEHFAERNAGVPLKAVTLSFVDADGQAQSRRGELMITEHGLEGSLIYAMAASLREVIERCGSARISIDLAPDRSHEALALALASPTAGRSMSERLRRHAGIGGVRAALLREALDNHLPIAANALADAIKCVNLQLTATRPLAEAISSAGGVRLEALDAGLMLSALPGVFCCGEMLDWEAPTGGYLLTASMASGHVAGAAAADWLQREARE